MPEQDPRRSGLVIFPIAYVAYFAFGRINFFAYRGVLGSEVLWLAGVGLASLVAAYAIVKFLASPMRRRALGGSREPANHRAVSQVGMVVGFGALILLIIEFRGIPLFAGDERLELPGWLAGLVYVAVLGTAMASVARLQHRKSYWIPLIGGSCVLLLMGFRTLPLVVVLTVFIFGWIQGRLKLTVRRVAASGVFVIGLSWLAVWRFGAGADAYFEQLLKDGMSPSFWPFAPLWITPREGVSVLAELHSLVPAIYPYQHGHVFWSSFYAMAPGQQESARLLIANLIGGREGITITPSILGEPYVDFGIPGVILAMFGIGVGLSLLHRWQGAARTWAPALAYSYVLASLVAAIHSGLLDPPTFFSIALICAYARSAEKRAARSP